MKFWNFITNDASSDDVELRIEGEMVSDDDAWLYEWYGITATSPNVFRQELSEYKGRNIKVWIDSFGGDVFAGVGIYNALKEHKGKVKTVIDGKAMSAATLPAMAGDEILMTPGSLIMIHNPWTFSTGEAKDMIHTANVLGEVKESIINIYQTKTSRSHKKLSDMMDNETWMSAKTAITEGFADSMLYSENQSPIENMLMPSRIAIQNSVSCAMTKALGIMQKIKPEDFKPKEEPRPAPVDLIKNKLQSIERMGKSYGL